MLEQEEQIALALAEVGRLATEISLKGFDVDGRPLSLENRRYTSRREEKKFQTPWGEVEIIRHVYQSSNGGQTVIPLVERARIIGHGSTPRFTRMISWKYIQLSAGRVSEYLEMNHSQKTSCKLIQILSAAVAQVAQDKEFEWEYALPIKESVVHHISVSRDGTTTPIVKEGYWETMCGTISFYDKKGDRMHTIYIACAPE
jgi:hypothetical protein